MPVQVDPHVLVHCAAVVVAHDDFDTQALISLGEKCGFGAVSDFNHVTDAWRAHPLLFVLVHFGIGAEAKRKLLDRVRHAGSVNICFAPTILFLQNATAADTVEFLDMGFDDVICLPEDSLVLATRLASQIGQEHIFIETRNYLGPDRPHAGHGHAADIEHANLRILRTPEHGVQVLHREVVHKHH